MVSLCPDVTYWWRRWEELAHSCNLSYGFHSEQRPSKSNETYVRSRNGEKGRSNFLSLFAKTCGCLHGKIKVLMCCLSFKHPSKHGLKEWKRLSRRFYTYSFSRKAVRSESTLKHDFITVLHPLNMMDDFTADSRLSSCAFWETWFIILVMQVKCGRIK